MHRLVATCIAALLFMTACASFETNAYKVIATTSITVDAAMNGWGDYVRAGKASSENQAAVRFAYGQYQRAMATAKSAVTAYRTSKDKATLDIALDVLDATKNTLLDLIAEAKK